MLLFKIIYFLAVVLLVLIIFSEKLGKLFYKQEKWSTALLFYKLNPISFFKSFDKLNLIANCYAELNNNQKAIEIYKLALKKDSDYQIYQNMGLSYTDLGLYQEAYNSFKTGYEIKYLQKNNSEKVYTTKYKIRHDIEQLEYLIENDILDNSFIKTLENYNALENKVLTDSDFYYYIDENDLINLDYDINFYLYQSDYTGQIINPELDYKKIEKDYLSGNPQINFFDNFLEEQALDEIRKFCLDSTIWHEYNRKRGYIASYMSNGFNFKLIYKLAEELKNKFPNIFKDYHLRNVWAFKYMDNSEGVLIHADEAVINVNFWITPDSANLDSNSGGMIVYNKEAPKDWHFNQYNKNTDYINDYLKNFKAESQIIPHKQNRVVIFNSSLFHQTDNFNFKSGYENHRINITLLFGKK